jgi:hypothetical protein
MCGKRPGVGDSPLGILDSVTKYRVVDAHGSEAANFVVDREDDFAAMRMGLSARDEHSRSVGRFDEQWLGEYQLEKWVAGGWDFAGRYAFVDGVLPIPA